MSEEEICMVLDTFMYLNYYGAMDGETLGEIVEKLSDNPLYGPTGVYHGEYEILLNAVGDEDISKLRIGNQSRQMGGYNHGTNACTFYNEENHSVYAVYRGTGDGEWLDNGRGMSECHTPQQQEALQWFEEAMDNLEVAEETRVIVTGHSKGGNKAQYVTMEYADADMIDKCVTVDGQGFSKVQIEEWKQEYGEEGFWERTGKIFGINGENDFVNVLGFSIVPLSQISYLRTPIAKENVAGYHDIKYMFDTYTDESGDIHFSSNRNSLVMDRGIVGDWAYELSVEVMELPEEQRRASAATLMQMMEMLDGGKDSVNGEKLSFAELKTFVLAGIPVIVSSLTEKEEGNNLIRAVLTNDNLGGYLPKGKRMRVDTQMLFQGAAELWETSRLLGNILFSVETHQKEVPWYMHTTEFLNLSFDSLEHELSQIKQKIETLASLQEDIARKYRSIRPFT